MDKLTILISGLNGFIGKHLADRFIRDGHNVAGIPRELLTDPEGLKLFVDQAKPHYIFALHSYGNMHDHDDENEVVVANIVKTYFLLQASKDVEYSAFINVSSSSVYGKKSTPMNERDTLDTDTLYGATKASSEYICRYFAKKYNKPIINVRPFTVIGVGEQEEHLIPTMIRACLGGKKMKLVRNPSHDFIDVQDFIDGVLTVALNANNYHGEVFNIGTGIYWTNDQVREAVENETGKTLKVVESSGMREYDNDLWVADPTKLKMLGWYPKKNLELSIKEMVEYEKARKKAVGN